MILQSKDVFDKLLDLNPESGGYRFLSRKEHPEIPLTKPSGAFSILNNTMLMLYRKDGVLHFRVGDRTIKLGDDVTSSVTSENDNRVFQLIKNGRPEICLTYLLPVQEVPFERRSDAFCRRRRFRFLAVRS